MKNNYADIWEHFMKLIDNRISSVSVDYWFKNCEIYKIYDSFENDKPLKIVTIQTPDKYKKNALISRYNEIIQELMEEILKVPCKIEIILFDSDLKAKEKITDDIPETIIDKLPDNKPKLNNNITCKYKDNIIEKYSFDNFLIGESNRLAYTASLSIAEQPGKTFNPFFLHGKSGLGKTHLMHAIGNYIKKNSNKRVLYITSDQFISDFTSINMKKTPNTIQSFKDKYRNIDVLMIDDIQFLGGAEKTQQEFFHTFNELYDSNKQIIISSDRSPDDLKLLEERLRTRFSWGLTVNIYPPDLDLKKRLVKNKMSCHEVSKLVDDEVIEYIASNSENDVRHIEGAITRLYAYAAIMGPHKIDLEFANEALKDYLKNSVYMNSNIAKIQKAVADYYKLTVEDLKSKKRANNVNYPRQIAIYLCRNYTDESYPKIGLEFGNRDHSTIMHAYDKITEDLKTNNQLKEIIKEIKNNIG